MRGDIASHHVQKKKNQHCEFLSEILVKNHASEEYTILAGLEFSYKEDMHNALQSYEAHLGLPLLSVNPHVSTMQYARRRSFARLALLGLIVHLQQGEMVKSRKKKKILNEGDPLHLG